MPRPDPAIDLYAALGATPAASVDALRVAWRRAAKRWHPDRPGGDADRFRAAEAAWRTLGDPSARAEYDRARADFLSAQATFTPSPPPSWQARARSWRPQPAAPQQAFHPGDRAHADLALPLLSVFSPQSLSVACRVATTCSACRGRLPYCPSCGGSGQRFVVRTVQVQVPAGVHDGQVLVLRGMGHDGPFFDAPGDLWLRIVWTRCGRWRWNAAAHRLETTERGADKAHAEGRVVRLRAADGRWGEVAVPPSPRGSLIRLPGIGLPGPSGARAPAWLLWA